MRTLRLAGLTLVLGTTAWAAGPAPGTPWEPESGGVIGRVYYDLDGDRRWSKGDEGLSGVRIYTATGESVTTGPDGRYHLFVLPAGYEMLGGQVLKLDRSSLPSGAVPLTSHRRLIQLTPGMTARADFPVRVPVPKTIESRGIKPPGREVPPLLRPGTPSMTTHLAGRTEPGCRVAVDGKPVEVGDNQGYKTEVAIRPGVNPHLVAVHCDDGHMEFLLSEIHWVQRAQGGDLVVPARPRTLASCYGPPPGTIDFTTSVDLNCRVEAGAEFAVAGKPADPPVDQQRPYRLRLEVVPGPNRFPVTAACGDARELGGAVRWEISRVRWSGALLGTLALRLGDKASMVGGRLRGQLRADLPADLKLVLGGSLDSLDQDEFDIMDFVEPAWDPSVHRRAPDPERGYALLGDSALIDDDNPSSARYLLRLSRKSSLVGFGGFETHDGLTTEIGTYRRALYGTHVVVQPFEDLYKEGQERVFELSLEGFHSPPGHRADSMASYRNAGLLNHLRTPAHEELLATGGTLYFLANSWLVEGSERVQVHQRDARTGLTLERRNLRRGIDYQLDWNAGRILLYEPLDSGILSQSAVRLVPAGSTASILVIDYEYLDDEASPSEAFGGRGAVTLRPAPGVNITGAVETVRQHGIEQDYLLYKGEARARLGQAVSLWAGYGKSDGQLLAPGYSVDGGISFASPLAEDKPGEASEAGLSVDLPYLQGRLLFRRWLTGYADTSLLASRDLTQLLAAFTVSPADSLDVLGRFSGTEQSLTAGGLQANRLLEGSLGVRLRLTRDLSLTGEGAFDSGSFEYDPWSLGEGSGDGHRVLAGLKLSCRLTDWLSLTAGHQHSLLTSGEGLSSRDLTLSSAGGQLALSERYLIGVEGGWGPELGSILRLSLHTDQENGSTVFAHSTVSLDHDALRSSQLTTGQAVPAANGVLLTTAQTLSNQGGLSSRGQQVGVVVPISDPLRLKFAYQRAELHDAGQESKRRELYLSPFFDRGLWGLARPGRRNAVFGRLSYLTGPLALSAGAEYRVDEHLPLASYESGSTTHRQTVVTLAGRWKVTEGLSLGGRLAWGETLGHENAGDGDGILEGRFLEGILTAAYRPAELDWLRLLFRFGAGTDLRPEQVLSIDESGFHTPWLAGSLAMLMRFTKYFQPTIVVAPWMGEYRFQGADVDPVKVTQLLGLLRVGSELIAGLGLAGEVRLSNLGTEVDVIPSGFDLPTGLKAGAAVELFYQLQGRDIGGLRLGLGYSFSNIPDPLLNFTDLSGSGSKGLFLRLEGMM